MCREYTETLSSQRGELCQLTSYCLLAPYLLFFRPALWAGARHCKHFSFASWHSGRLCQQMAWEGHCQAQQRRRLLFQFPVRLFPQWLWLPEHAWDPMSLTLKCSTGTSMGRFLWTSFRSASTLEGASCTPAPAHGTPENSTGNPADGFLCSSSSLSHHSKPVVQKAAAMCSPVRSKFQLGGVSSKFVPSFGCLPKL